jgi:hypothetical protein
MPELKIENYIIKYLAGDTQKDALEFVRFLRENEMQFYKDENADWANNLYWWIKCEDEYFCFILINGYEEGKWVVWFEDGNSDCFADFPVDEQTKEIAWANADVFLGNCGGGQCEGVRKVLLGRVFESLYRTLMCFKDPSGEAIKCMEKLVKIRKLDILRDKERAV